MSLFDRAFKFTEENEGGFVDNKKDKGGATFAGVSSKWFPNDYNAIINSSGEQQHELIKDFYLREFWNPLYEKIFDVKLAIRLFDLSVNLGKKPAIKLLQKSFNDISIADITLDGTFGHGTLRAVNLAPQPLYPFYIKNAEAYYRSLSDFPTFGKGWLNRLNKEIK